MFELYVAVLCLFLESITKCMNLQTNKQTNDTFSYPLNPIHFTKQVDFFVFFQLRLILFC